MRESPPETSPTENVVDIDPGCGPERRTVPEIGRGAVIAAANRAARTVAPLWPLENFVAVNPFLGIAGLPFADADNLVDRIWGARLVMPRKFYANAIRSGELGRRHILQALEELEDSVAGTHSVDSVYLLAFTEEPSSLPTPTLAEILGAETGRDWPGFVIDRISSWAAGYFDQGQASWRSPWRDETPYTAWRGEAELDQTPEIMGIAGFRGIVRTLPENADDMLVLAATAFGLSENAFATYVRRLLATIAGWAGHARFRGWTTELAGGNDSRVRELLAVRAAWDYALADAFGERHPDALETLRQRLATPLHPDVAKCHVVNLILHTAYEIAERESLLEALSEPRPDDGGAVDDENDASGANKRPPVQAVFCIDARSERFRRALERSDPEVETLGFAGFFGFALEVAPVDGSAGGAQCPGLLTPEFLVRETPRGADETATNRCAEKMRVGRRLAAAWRQFSGAAVSSFAFVESLGLTFAWRLLADSVGFRLAASGPRLAPALDEAQLAGRQAGIPLARRIEVAKGLLAGLSLGDKPAPIVALVGHGSETANNPYASRLNCGACGGHSGEANALVAAGVLNDPAVRRALGEAGRSIPADTVFVAGLHDTTTDDVTILDADALPESHQAALAAFRGSLESAGRRCRHERARTFGLPDDGRADAAIRKRAVDWSQVRPEWGLAGCAAFFAAPRERTRAIDLGGRAFLHSYDWRSDRDFAVLEQIMTAPLSVASWISLQYFASTVDNRMLGSGDKTLHNVVGGLGVFEGNGGDLRPGLPMQTLHDGERLVHRPVRLNAFIEAPAAAIGDILARHEPLRQLADNGWIHLFAIQDEGRSLQRYAGNSRWKTAVPGALLFDRTGRSGEAERQRRRA